MSKPIIAIVGRPNVGKSTLFNRIVGERKAITADEPGTTRDRLFANAEWEDREFALVDTGGLEVRPDQPMLKAVRAQVNVAIEDADAILFLTDVSSGVTPADDEVADVLRRSGRPVVLACNKADNPRRELDIAEFYRMGLGEPLPISAHHNQGIGVLLDRLLELLPEAPPEPPTEGMRLAIVGRPNTGKSSLINVLAGEERVVVSDIPGTTRDSIDLQLTYKGEKIVLVDTAGVRRRGRVEVGVEKFSVLRALRAVERADIALLILDASELGSAQDAHIAGYVLEAHKGLVLVVNKWDLARDLELKKDEAEALIRHRFKFAPYASIVFISALRGEGLGKLMRTAQEVYQQRQVRVSTGDLNRIVGRAVGEHLPRLVGRRRLHILYVTQSDINPPTFVFFVNDPKLMHFSYERYLENRLRDLFGFTGTPLKFVFRRRGEG
ncbi:MAG: ribosome biogenesis GTPase Der [Chloroflexi bacterium]|nr:ribosome biogenesis GTPase Der [Chloroflexota bacterium]